MFKFTALWLIVLVRNECGGQKAAESVMGLVRIKGERLPRMSVQELLMEDEDKRLQNVQKLCALCDRSVRPIRSVWPVRKVSPEGPIRALIWPQLLDC